MIGGQRRNLLRVARGLLQIPRFDPMSAMNTNRTMQGVNMGKLWDLIDVLRNQMERLIDGEIARSPGISRAEAANRAVWRYRRDNR